MSTPDRYQDTGVRAVERRENGRTALVVAAALVILGIASALTTSTQPADAQSSSSTSVPSSSHSSGSSHSSRFSRFSGSLVLPPRTALLAAPNRK